MIEIQCLFRLKDLEGISKENSIGNKRIDKHKSYVRTKEQRVRNIFLRHVGIDGKETPRGHNV